MITVKKPTKKQLKENAAKMKEAVEKLKNERNQQGRATTIVLNNIT